MQVMMLLNGLGVIVAAAFSGLLMARGQFPTGAAVAGMLFLFAAFFPFFHEYGIIRRGFLRLETDLLSRLRRKFQPRPKVEVFNPGDSRPAVWRQRGDPVWLLLFISCFAGFLLLFDLIEYVPMMLRDEQGQRPITNF